MIRRREEVVDGRDAPSVLGRERTQVEALRRERHLCTNQPVSRVRDAPREFDLCTDRHERVELLAPRLRVGEALHVQHQDAGPRLQRQRLFGLLRLLALFTGYFFR